MFHFAGNEAFWLNVTNLGLGLAVLAILVAVLFSAGKEALARFRQQMALRPRAATHAFVVGGLGLTMADGGERIQPREEKPKSPEAKG
jgi:hypothetical protein